MAKFEEDLDELERVVEQIERGELSLEENVDLYEKGILLSRACKDVLRRSEARIEALVDPEDDGPVRTEEIGMAVAEDADAESIADQDDSLPEDDEG